MSVLEGGPFDVVYADPSWRYDDKADAGKRGSSYQYSTLTTDQICSVNVSKLCADDALLFLWATPPMLREAIRVMAAWEFEYRTVAFNWVKLSKTGTKLHWGMGNWTRANSELCLLGVRGRPRRMSASVHQVILATVGKPSAKPPEARRRIVRLTGRGVRRLELFARERARGWTSTGLELDGVDFLDLLSG